MSEGQGKHSYTIPCSRAFRDAVSALARKRRINVADLARSVVLVIPMESVSRFPDPGEPPSGDRETVVLKSGKSKGRPWQRKPRLQVRIAPGYEIDYLRRALNMALAMDRGDVVVHVDAPSFGIEMDASGARKDLEHAQTELEKLRSIVSVLAFEPLKGGVRSHRQALHVLGFAPTAEPDERAIRAQFRKLATVHHPDSGYGSHERMSQLNSAMEILRENLG